MRRNLGEINICLNNDILKNKGDWPIVVLSFVLIEGFFQECRPNNLRRSDLLSVFWKEVSYLI